MAELNSLISQLDQAQRLRLERLLLEFDQQWGPAALADCASGLSREADEFRRVALVELVRIDMERHWQHDNRRAVEDYLSDYPELGGANGAPVELLLTEYQLRRRRGLPCDLADYVRRFPTAGPLLQQRVETPSVFGSAPASLETTSRRLDESAIVSPSLPDSDSMPTEFGRYRILRLLGRGAMGAVYLAHDTTLHRDIALKIPKFEGGISDQAIERLYREARSAATLRHPHICPVYDVDQIDGQHYITMAYIEGRELLEIIAAKGAQPARRAANFIRKLAKGLEEAHRRGIVHRDLKPANIMVDRQGDPVIMDFGLALQAEDARLTRSGAIVGTPAYMALEQVEANSGIDARADIYALGVILYELLTGALPFQGSVAQVLAQVLGGQPVPPSQVTPDIDPQIEAICLRMMAKRPADRYQSAADVAQALADYLRGAEASDIHAPASHAGNSPLHSTIAKSAIPIAAAVTVTSTTTISSQPIYRRKIVLIAAAAPVLGLLLLGVVLKIMTPTGVLRVEVDDPQIAVLVDGQSIALRDKQYQASQKPGTHRLSVLIGQTPVPFNGAVELNDKQHRLVATIDGSTQLQSGQFQIARNGETVVRIRLEAVSAAETQSAITPSPPAVATNSSNQETTARSPTTASAKPQPPPAISPLDALRREDIDPYELAIAGGGDAEQAPKELVAIVGDSRLKHWSVVNSVAFSPDGQSVASAGNDSVIRIWDVTTGKQRLSLPGEPPNMYGIAISPDGKTIATPGKDNTAKLWNLESGEFRSTCKGHRSTIYSMAFSPDGRTLATAGLDGAVRIWDADTGADRFVLSGPSGHQLPVEQVFALAFGPKGLTLASAGRGKSIRLWDVDSPRERTALLGHEAAIRTVAYSPNGDVIASAGDDRTIRFWNAANGEPMHVLKGHIGQVMSLAFSPDGQAIASGGLDSIRFWDSATGTARFSLSKSANCVAFSPDGESLASGSRDNAVRLWEVKSGMKRVSPTCQACSLAFSPDGRTLAIADKEATLKLLDSSTLRVLGELPVAQAQAIAFTANGRTLLTNRRAGPVQAWDLATKDEQAAITDASKYTAAYSQDGRLIATGGLDKVVRIWTASTASVSHALSGHSNPIDSLAFDPAGRLVASAASFNGEPELKIWDLETSAERFTLTGHTSHIEDLKFSPDGRMLASASFDNTIKLWDVEKGEIRHTLADHTKRVERISFTADGCTLASVAEDGTLRLWDVETGQQRHRWQIGPPRCHILDVAFDPTGKYIATANGNGTIYILRLPSN